MGGRRVIGRLLVVGAAALGSTAAPADAAVAHAQVVGSVPADGAVVDRPPDQVTLRLHAKPATVEGDPVQVFSPAGDRMDAGAAVTGLDGRELGVRLRAERPAGEYRVVYRIVSSDSHLIAGQLSFISVGPAEELAFARAPTAEPPRLRQAAPPNLWPRLALIVAAGHVVAVLAARKQLRARPT
jgi:methionine-rich copper-binding protein CopC